MSVQMEAKNNSIQANPDAAPDELARTTYQELRSGGLTDTDIIAFAGELLSLVATEVRSSQAAAE